MRVVSASRKAVREALAGEGWRFALTRSAAEFRMHRDRCRGLTFSVGHESDNRSRTIRERLVGPEPCSASRSTSDASPARSKA